MYSYRNERFKRGNTVQLRYNPSQSLDEGYWDSTLINYTNSDEARYIVPINADPDAYGIGTDVITCSSFGGEISGSSTTENWVGVKVPKDCFNDNYLSYIKDYNDKVYLFEGSSSPSIDKAYISSHASSSQSTKYGKYGVNYIVNPIDTIKVTIKETNFDVMAQLLMSEAVAVVTCDTDYTTHLQVPNGVNELVAFGGGSYNPMVRQGHIISNTIEKKRGTSTYEITIKLLG